MARIRPFAREDIPHVADLYGRAYRGRTGTSSQALKSYVDEVFLHNPWVDDALPSLVCQENGRIVGFLGVIPRPMLLKGRQIRVAVGCSFMVEPDSRTTLAGLELLRTFFSGPQDLSITDSANDSSRKVWERVGGSTALLYSMYWALPLRPREYASYFRTQTAQQPSPFAFASRLAPYWADAVPAHVSTNDLQQPEPSLLEEDLDAEVLLECLSQFGGTESVRPEYDCRSLKWLLGMAAQKKFHGDLRKALVRNSQSEIVGWYLYYLNRTGISQVLQISARRNAFREVLDRMFYSAWREGAIAISGRMDPRFMGQLPSDCFLRNGSWVLVHSNNSDALNAICSGDAFLTRLEGEWWTRFLELVN